MTIGWLLNDYQIIHWWTIYVCSNSGVTFVTERSNYLNWIKVCLICVCNLKKSVLTED